MPQSVEAFANGRDIRAAEKAKRAILDLYSYDIGKFAGRLKHKVRAIWNNIPGALSAQEDCKSMKNRNNSCKSINDRTEMI